MARVAVFCDSFDEIGGVEHDSLEIAKELNATVITAYCDREKVRDMGFGDVPIIELPPVPAKPRFLRQFFLALSFYLCDFSRDFDFFVLYGRLPMFAAKRHRPHVYVCADTFREFYELSGFLQEHRSIPQKIWNFFHSAFFRFFISSQLRHVQTIFSCSAHQQKKIMENYGRDSVLCYSPVRTEKFFCKPSRGYWLSVNRLSREKRVELQFEAFRLMPDKRLVVVSPTSREPEFREYLEEVKSLMPDNVELLLDLEHSRIRELFACCEGFIATSLEEPFGRTVVEAMASGKPVVAVDSGGFRETVVNGKTGLLVAPNPRELAEAVRKISKKPEKFRRACIRRAKEFDAQPFFRLLSQYVPAD